MFFTKILYKANKNLINTDCFLRNYIFIYHNVHIKKKISISQIKEVAQEAYNEVKGSTGGKNADYIPYLAT